VALIRTDVSEEKIASIIRMKSISELRTTLAVITNYEKLLQLIVSANVVPIPLILSTLMLEALRSSETLALTRATRHNNPEDGILHNHHTEDLKSHIALNGWVI
jgi:hypothetical protein